jgi:hypothetical protein
MDTSGVIIEKFGDIQYPYLAVFGLEIEMLVFQDIYSVYSMLGPAAHLA